MSCSHSSPIDCEVDYLFKSKAEKMILKQIEELSMTRIASHRHDIEQSIKFMYWQGTFSKRKADKMTAILMNKYEKVMDDHLTKVEEAMERDYQAMRNHTSK
jgi:hypothetical protein